VGRCKKNRKSLMKIPTHPCLAMEKMLKDFASENRKFEVCNFLAKSYLSIYLIKKKEMIVF
jgi:hypothetical protein